MGNVKIETVQEFIDKYYEANPNGHYFDRDTMKFWGNTRSRMYLYRNTVKGRDILGNEHECYVLKMWQRNPSHRMEYAYFDIATMQDIPDFKEYDDAKMA